MKKYSHFETLQVHAGQEALSDQLSRAVPIYQTTSYLFKSSEHGADLFSLKEDGHIYTRLSNPTTRVLEERIAALEGGTASVVVASGHAAQFLALAAILEAGDSFVASPFLYGGSHNQFKVAMGRLGVTTRFSRSLLPADFERLIDDTTRVIYLETIGNPSFTIPDFEAFAKLADTYSVPLIVDNTFAAAGWLCRPIEYGANVVVESLTKWVGGHGTTMGGAIVDGGNFNWANGKFKRFTEPSEGYHGLCFWDRFGPSAATGNVALAARVRAEGLRDFGPAISPFNAFLLLQGLETLSLRMERHCYNTLRLAEWLANHPKIEAVSYPGLPNHPAHALARKYLRNGFGGVLTFRLKGDTRSVARFVESLRLVSHLANVGDAKTLIIQPAATTHAQLTDTERERAGVPHNLLRVSVGLEHIDDIIADFDSAFALM